MRFETIPSQTSDNFFYLLADDEGVAALIDPIDAPSAIARVREGGYRLRYVINTHFHPDHVGGDDAVLAAFEEAELLVPADEVEAIRGQVDSPIAGVIRGGDEIEVGALRLEVIDTPGHTPGHVSLHVDELLLSGDTIFVGGAGNCRFGGDPGVLFATYRDVLARLDDAVTFFPGHDYAVRNLEFILDLEPHNEKAKEVLGEARHHGGEEDDLLFTTTLGEERLYNPFFRFADEALRATLQSSHTELWQVERERSEDDDEATFRALRELRNRW